jgi:drug/metabolite transporter (DMT)-like permease
VSAPAAVSTDPAAARRAVFLLVLANLVWGASFVVVKEALRASTPLTFTAVRFGIAALALAPFTPLSAPWSRAELAAGTLLGGLLALGFASQAVGLVTTTPSRSAFIVATSAVLAALLAFAVVRERPRPPVLAALALAALGMYLLTAPGAGGINRGDVLTGLTALCFGGQIVAVTEFSRRHDPVRLVLMQTAGTAVATAFAAPLFEAPRIDWTPAFVAALGYAAVFATALALLWQMRAQRHLTSARAALIFCLEPVFAALTSWLWLGERLSLFQWVGGGLILGGMVLAELPRARRAA